MPSRRDFIINTSLLGTFPFISLRSLQSWSAIPVSNDVEDMPRLIAAPGDPAAWPAFRAHLHEWRAKKQKETGYTGSAYEDPAFEWARTNFSCLFLMMYDLDFYDPSTNQYTVDKVLNKGVHEFGGYDSVVLWHAYPRIGIDERNQFDFYRDMPGGLSGVRRVVSQFHAGGVKVFINYNPWDTGTRREGQRDLELLAETIGAIDADGIFLDTLKEADAAYRRKLDDVKPGIVLEGEFAADLENLSTNHLSWAQWFSDRYVPGILRNKWFERRHIQHQIARWDRDHTTELHQAWMNGSGMMIWENVFGQWMGWNERDKSILRAILPIQRRYHDLFNGEGWTPLEETMQHGIFASMWEGNGIRLWTLVNRHEHDVSGDLLMINPSHATLYFDLITGEQVLPGKGIVKGMIRARSVGCFISGSKQDLGSDFQAFLSSVKHTNERYNGSASVPSLSTSLKKTDKTKPHGAQAAMVRLMPHTYNQTVEFMIREVGIYSSAMDINVSQTLNDPYIMQRMVHIPYMAIDIYPVTNAQYYKFLQSSGYAPAEKYLFLKHWKNGRPPEGKGNHPVVYVDLNDARAYAKWAGKRLPAEGEWQFAAEGYEQVRYPWGKDLKEGKYNNTEATTAVDAYPGSKSPFGCFDMCGNTWELTESEYSDRYNRFCILKGGSYYQAKDSMWYTNGGPVPSRLAVKFLMMYPGLDRCSTVGFRCAADL